MSQADPTTSDQASFVWHPDYKGQTHAQVRSDLEHEIRRDQRSYAMALDGAEHAEHDSLSTVVEVERRWSGYDFDWAEMDAGTLADRVLAFEIERERGRELIAFEDYRAAGGLVGGTEASSNPRGALGTRQMILIGGVILVIVIIALALTLA